LELNAALLEIVQHSYQVGKLRPNLSSFQTFGVPPCSSFFKQRCRASRFVVAPESSSLKIVLHSRFFSASCASRLNLLLDSGLQGRIVNFDVHGDAPLLLFPA
jgi:hypothetical protein